MRKDFIEELHLFLTLKDEKRGDATSDKKQEGRPPEAGSTHDKQQQRQGEHYRREDTNARKVTSVREDRAWTYCRK